jgi:hypothetical protein
MRLDPMKHILLFVFTLLLASPLAAQYRKMQVYELSCAADLIVQGKISNQDPLNFVVEVSNVHVGSYADKTISIVKFRNTKVAKRWGKYTLGEEVLLYLRNDNGHYHVIGEGGEGEKLVVGAETCIDSRGEGLKNRFGYHAVSPTTNIYAEKVPTPELLAASIAVRGCYQLKYVERETPEGQKVQFPVVQTTCDDKAKDELRSASWVHETVVNQAETAIRGAQ